jgi:hypothetical protein
MDDEYKDYASMRDAMRTGILVDWRTGAEHPVGPNDKRILGSAMARYESVNPGAREGVVPHGADEAAPDPIAAAQADTSRSPFESGNTVPVAHAPKAGPAGAPGDLYFDPDRNAAAKALGHAPSPVELEAFQNQQWNDAATQAESSGRYVERVPSTLAGSHLPPGSSFGERAREKVLSGLDIAAAGAHGVLGGIVPGGGKLAAAAIGGPEYAAQAQESVSRHPEAAFAGSLYGGAKGIATKAAGSAYGALTRLGSKLVPNASAALGLAGRLGAASASGAAGGALQAEGENLASEAVGQAPDQSVGQMALLGGALGGGAHLLGEGFRAGAGAIERGKFGPGLAAGEELGGRPTLTGYKMTPDSPLRELEQAREAGRLGSTADVAAERLAPKYAEAGGSITRGVNQAASTESQAMRESLVQPAPVPPESPLDASGVAKFLERPAVPDPLPPALSPEHADAVAKFTRGYDSAIRHLQGGGTREEVEAWAAANAKKWHSASPAEYAAEAEGAAAALKDALEQHSAGLPTVYRGMGLDPAKTQEFTGSHSFGLGNRATSTSFDPHIASNFAWGSEPAGVKTPDIVTLKLKGAQGIPVGEYGDELFRGEREAIEKGGRYKVTGRHFDESDPRVKYVEGEAVGPDYKDPTVPQTVSMEPVMKAAAGELQGPNVLPDGPLRKILQTVVERPQVNVEEWERLVGQIDQLAKLDKAKGVVDPRLARISAAMRESAEGFPGLNQMRAGQAERFAANEKTMSHGGLPLRNKEVPGWNEMTADEQKHLYGVIRNQTGDIAKPPGQPKSSVPMVRRAMDQIAGSAGLRQELDLIPKLESVDQVRQALRPHGLNARLHAGGVSTSAMGKAAEFAELRGYPTIRALGSVPPDADLLQLLQKSPNTMELLKSMRQKQLGVPQLANRLGLRGGVIGARGAAAVGEITDEDAKNLYELMKLRQQQEQQAQP